MATFSIDPRLTAGNHAVADLELCAVRLQDDVRFPWLVLIPRRGDRCEIDDLAPSEQGALMAEIVRAGVAVRAVGLALGRPVEKLNVGALGNITPQLHVHVVGRRQDDAAWPGPVWGVGTARALDPEALQVALAAARQALAG